MGRALGFCASCTKVKKLEKSWKKVSENLEKNSTEKFFK
jgi:hypothetical protein